MKTLTEKEWGANFAQFLFTTTWGKEHSTQTVGYITCHLRTIAIGYGEIILEYN